jgi:hypothetical protein
MVSLEKRSRRVSKAAKPECAGRIRGSRRSLPRGNHTQATGRNGSKAAQHGMQVSGARRVEEGWPCRRGHDARHLEFVARHRRRLAVDFTVGAQACF